MTIRKKTILILLVCIIIPMCFVGMLGYYHARKTLESLRMEELKSIADLKAKRIEDYIAEHKKHITIAQHRPTLIKYTAFEIDMAPVYERIQNTTGLGETGETLIAKKAGNQAVFLNPLRHDPDAALKRKVVFGERQAIPIQKALKGNNGCGISVDYRGQAVIAAWRYIPSLDWGLVAKIDLAEAFEPVTTLRDFVLMLVIAVIVLSIFAAFIVAKSLSDPIQALQQGVEEIGIGNLDHKVATHAKDEIGQLGRAFDQMTEKLKAITASRDVLDREVNEREKVEKELQKSMREIDERVKELNCLFEISRVVEKRELTLEEMLQGIVGLIPSAWQYPDITCAKGNESKAAKLLNINHHTFRYRKKKLLGE